LVVGDGGLDVFIGLGRCIGRHPSMRACRKVRQVMPTRLIAGIRTARHKGQGVQCGRRYWRSIVKDWFMQSHGGGEHERRQCCLATLGGVLDPI